MIQSKNNKTIIIAEVGQSHDGSLGLAHSLIDAVYKTGADCIKFQTHIAEAETTIHEPWRVKFSFQDKTRYDYWKRMEFSEQQWIEIKDHAHELGLKFISSPFSLRAVELLKRVGVYGWKIASGEANNVEIMKSISETNNEVFLSTGMSSINEIDLSVKKIKDYGLPLTILQCTSIYPTPPEKIGLNMINYLRNRYECNVGLSDHSGKLYTGLAAASIGIEVLEVHVTFSKEMFGPDVSSSISIDELKLLVEGVRFIEIILEHEVDKDAIAEELKPMRKIFRKSVVYLKDMKEGTIIKRQDICFKKPGTGVKPEDLNNVLGRELRRSVSADSLLSLDDLN